MRRWKIARVTSRTSISAPGRTRVGPSVSSRANAIAAIASSLAASRASALPTRWRAGTAKPQDFTSGSNTYSTPSCITGRASSQNGSEFIHRIPGLARQLGELASSKLTRATTGESSDE
jgi:hypothetical protein